MVRDPICRMEVDPESSNWVAEYNGEDHYFCSESCQKTFMKDPVKYTEIRPMGQSQGVHGGHMGGCCGVDRGRGWLSYVHLAIMIIFILLLLVRF